MQKQAPVAALHHGHPETHETSGAIAQFMRDPLPFRNSVSAKQYTGNLAVGGVVKTTVERAQGEDEPVSPCLGKCCWIGARVAAVQGTPETQCSSHPDFE